MGVVSWWHLPNLQLQWDWWVGDSFLIYNCNRSDQLVTLNQFTTAMGVVTWLHLLSIQLQWECSVGNNFPIYNYKGSGQSVTPSQFTSTMGVVSWWHMINLQLQCHLESSKTFEDTKGLHRSCKSKDRQYIDNKKKDKMTYNCPQYITQKTKIWATHNLENVGGSLEG